MNNPNPIDISKQTVAFYNACKIDVHGKKKDFWLVTKNGEIVATGVLPGGEKKKYPNPSSVDLVNDATNEFENACIHYSVKQVIDCEGQIITPGFFDIHSHGAMGQNWDDEVIDQGINHHLQHGTTRFLLSIITNPIDVMQKNIVRVKDSANPLVIGLHLEGPFISPDKKGAHELSYLKNPELEHLIPLLEAGKMSGNINFIKQITIAPELPGAKEAIKTIRKYGIIPAIGHTSCDYDLAKEYFIPNLSAGTTCGQTDGTNNSGNSNLLDQTCPTILTHTFNRMEQLSSRNPGPIAAALESASRGYPTFLEVINDGVHVAGAMVKLLFNNAPQNIMFVTDAMSATGLGDGDYKLGDLDVYVKNGQARLRENDALAGSTLTLDKAVARSILELGLDECLAVAAASFVPAKALRAHNYHGSLVTGKYADILLFDKKWQLKQVYYSNIPTMCKKRVYDNLGQGA